MNSNTTLIFLTAKQLTADVFRLQMLLRYLYFNETVEEAVRAPRIHHQLLPMRLQYEAGFSTKMIYELAKKGHKMHAAPSDSGFAALTAIGRSGNHLIPVFDHRRGGSLEIIE